MKRIDIMKKIVFVLIAVMICVSFASCDTGINSEDEKEDVSNGKAITSIKSFGNQAGQIREWQGFTVDNGWVYTVISIGNGYEGIVRFHIDNPEKKEMIYKYETDRLSQLAVVSDWVYFRAGTGDHGYEETNLYKIKTDGSDKAELAKNMWSYILTEDEIIYDLNSEKSNDIYVVDHEGKSKRKLGGSELVGIDNGWIFYSKYISDFMDVDMPYNLYKMRPDGKDKQKVLDDVITDCIVEKDTIYYIGYDEESEETTDLVQITSDGEKTVLDSDIPFRCLNKEGNQLYYEDEEESKIYKINIGNPEKREMVFDYGDDINQGIFLYDGEVYIMLTENLVYIDRDGNVEKVKLWDF